MGGIAHLVTLNKWDGWWPNFHNPDDEVCIECGKVPGDPGCKRIGSRFTLDSEDKIYHVDHSPTEPIAVADQGNPGRIAVRLPGGDQEEGLGHQPLHERLLPEEEENAGAENDQNQFGPVDQQQNENDMPIPAPMEPNEHRHCDQLAINIEQHDDGSNDRQQENAGQASSQGQAHSQHIAIPRPRQDIADTDVADSPNMKG